MGLKPGVKYPQQFQAGHESAHGKYSWPSGYDELASKVQEYCDRRDIKVKNRAGLAIHLHVTLSTLANWRDDTERYGNSQSGKGEMGVEDRSYKTLMEWADANIVDSLLNADLKVYTPAAMALNKSHDFASPNSANFTGKIEVTLTEDMKDLAK